VDPYGVTGFFKEPLADGLRAFEIQAGYLEVVDLEAILMEAGINEKTIFYGVEEIHTSNPVWTLFSAIKKLTPNIVQFYDLPPNKLHGVVTRVEL
jgi:KUP system potassium uptake protein